MPPQINFYGPFIMDEVFLANRAIKIAIMEYKR